MADGIAAAPGLPFSADPDTGIFRAGVDTFDISTGGVKRLEVRADGDVDLPTGASAALRLSGDVFLHQRGGVNNTSVGRFALNSVTAGIGNAASGSEALRFNTTGGFNTASGYSALRTNTTANFNTASGSYALRSNTSGSKNTASGFSALRINTTGSDNTASGSEALLSNTTGNSNTASGANALKANTTGINNTASGAYALRFNSTGSFNTASGLGALLSNTTGNNNTADGRFALRSNTTGNYNTASGRYALRYNTSGASNTAIGHSAGQNLTTGNNNIAIGANVLGVAAEANTIRIGSGTTRAFITGIRGVTTDVADAIPVLIDSAGQLGTVSSSRRFKWDVQDMTGASSDLMRLRPVTFRYNQCSADGSYPLQYGLIAEEVAEVYPGLVVRSADGQIETVQYYKIDAMLLNEVQKLYLRGQEQDALNREQAALNREQAAQLADRQREIEQLRSRLDALAALVERLTPVATKGGDR